MEYVRCDSCVILAALLLSDSCAHNTVVHKSRCHFLLLKCPRSSTVLSSFVFFGEGSFEYIFVWNSAVPFIYCTLFDSRESLWNTVTTEDVVGGELRMGKCLQQ